jgi:hypothetical protein
MNGPDLVPVLLSRKIPRVGYYIHYSGEVAFSTLELP